MGERPAPVPGVDLLFTEEDAVEILDFLAWEESLCPNCGEPKSECFDRANVWAYVAEVHTCHACAASSRAMDKVTRTPGADFTFVRKRL